RLKSMNNNNNNNNDKSTIDDDDLPQHILKEPKQQSQLQQQLQPYKDKDIGECKTCHAMSGTIIGASGIYSLMIRKSHPESKGFLTLIGASTLSFGVYWILEPHLLERGWLKSPLKL
ncbi:hypothetical protein SAMD00019534_054840, partial [Acytostelium subglobosum LB1]|uniref:hypothetical protein n=1 Tax=Acytostelium subglobosum LB1 TaxID=1410327 RepID=UPI0006452192